MIDLLYCSSNCDFLTWLSDAVVKMLKNVPNLLEPTPLPSLYGWVAEFAHEEDALCRVFQDEDQEWSVESQGVWQAHGHDLNGGGGCCFCSCLIHAEHSLVGHL